MKIFTDMHHGDLYHSLHLLFAERLGFELYHPIGMDWFHEGYWLIAAPYKNAIGTVKQYLSIGNENGYINHPYKKSEKKNPAIYLKSEPIKGKNSIVDGVYHMWDNGHRCHYQAITLEKFKSMKFDIIMPSYPTHDTVYEKLRNRYQPQAKLVMQMGNRGQRTHLSNVLHSCAYKGSSNQHCLRYHQEIDPSLFQFTEPNPDTRNIFSVVNCAEYLNIYNTYQPQTKNANWKYYGAGSPDGALPGSRGVSVKMKEANVAWHLKKSGGVGHSTKGWFSIGRPLVTNMNPHRTVGGDALALFEPGVTCIDIDSGTVHENSKKIEKLLEPEENLKWCKRVNRRFNDVVNYERNEQQVRKFLENLR